MSTTPAPLGRGGSQNRPGTSASRSRLVHTAGAPDTNSWTARSPGSESVSCVTAPEASSIENSSEGQPGPLSTQTTAAPSGEKPGR